MEITMSRILSCPIPSNINPLSPNGFMFSIAKLPDISYLCQEVNLPSASLPENEFATPLVNIAIPGDRMEFQPLTIQFLIDSEMKNYTSIFDWMNGLGFPQSNDQFTSYTGSSQDQLQSTKFYSDATLQILGNTNNNLKSVKFVDVFPTSLESLVFTSTSQDVQYLVGSATFKYTYYTFT